MTADRDAAGESTPGRLSPAPADQTAPTPDFTRLDPAPTESTPPRAESTAPRPTTPRLTSDTRPTKSTTGRLTSDTP
ncbi:hypothetical protein GL306_24300, partial [Nocardia seriolae]|nr:hypothetical protein [Nocardia seriolae]